MITSEAFRNAGLEFESEESRGSFYEMAVNLLNKGLNTEAYLLLLATWNFASFRYAVKDFDLMAFEKTVNLLETNFQHLDGQNIRSADLDSLREDISVIYGMLSQIKGIQYTGASKMMHLRNRELFVMWDGYVRGSWPRKRYEQLDIVSRGDWEIKAYGTSADDYLEYLKDMQHRFANLSFSQEGKTFAKAIDEFNYVNITLPIQMAEKAASRSRAAEVAGTIVRTDESQPTNVPNADVFRRVLGDRLASSKGSYIDVMAGELHDVVGTRSGRDSRMPTCCNVMLAAMQNGGTVLAAPPKGRGPTLTIRYRLPR